MKNKVVDATIVETAIRQPEKGTAVTTMHYITFESLPARDGWYDQATLRLAPASSVSGSAAPAARQPAGGAGKGGAKKARGMSAKAHLLDERRDAALKRLGSPRKAEGPASYAAGTGTQAGGARGSGGSAAQTVPTGTKPARPDCSSMATTEDGQLCTWVWYWSGARSDRLPHDPSRTAKSSGNSNAMRWVETSLARRTGRGSESEGEGAAGKAETEITRFSTTWLRQHVDEVKSQTFPGAKVFLRRNSLNACHRILAATVLEGETTATQRQPHGEQRKHPDRGATVATVKSTGAAVPLPKAERDHLAALHANGRKRPSASVTMDQAASGLPGTADDEKAQACEAGGHGSKPKKIKRQGVELTSPGTDPTAAAAAVPSPATNQSMAIHHIAPAQGLNATNADGHASKARSSQTQPQGQSANSTMIPVSSLMDSSSGSSSEPSSSGTSQVSNSGARYESDQAAHLRDGNAQPDHSQQPLQPSQTDRQWSVAEETRLADLVSKYWPLIIEEAQRVGSPILPRDSPAWVKISTELGTIAGSNTPLHGPESCNTHWTAVAKQMQAQQEAQEAQERQQQEQQKKQQAHEQEQRRRAMEQQQEQLLITQQRDQLYFEQQQIVLSEVYNKILQQQEAEKQQQQLALQQQTQQYQTAIAQQQQQLISQCGGQASPLQQQQLQQNQQLLLLQLQQQQLQQQQILEQQHQQQLQQHQQQQAQSQRPLTSVAVASVLVEGHPSNVIGSLRVVYPLLHKMLRESGFGSNVLPLMGCHGQLMVKVSFSFRTPTPSAVKEGEPLVFTMKGAPWLRAMLYQNGVMADCGFSWSPPDWLDLIETLQQLSSVVQQQSLADGLREALWRRDGRRRTYFCCLLRHPVQQQQGLSSNAHIQGCGIRLLDQNELRQHIAKEHAHPAVQRHSRIMLAEMEVQRRKQLSLVWAQQNTGVTAGFGSNGAAAHARNIEDDNAWVISKTEELLTRTLPSENLESFRARVKALRLQEGEAVDDDDDCMLAYAKSLLSLPLFDCTSSTLVSFTLPFHSCLVHPSVCYCDLVSLLTVLGGWVTRCRYERVSVRDGTTMTKMSCPGRTRRCKHLQCFDLRSHVQEAYRKRTKWAATGMLQSELCRTTWLRFVVWISLWPMNI